MKALLFRHWAELTVVSLFLGHTCGHAAASTPPAEAPAGMLRKYCVAGINSEPTDQGRWFPDPRDPALAGEDIAIPFGGEHEVPATVGNFLYAHSQGSLMYFQHRDFGIRTPNALQRMANVFSPNRTRGQWRSLITQDAERTIRAGSPVMQFLHEWDIRGVIPLDEAMVHLTTSKRTNLQKALKNYGYRITVNHDFEHIVRRCAAQTRDEKIRYSKDKKSIKYRNYPPEWILEFQPNALKQDWYWNMTRDGKRIPMRTTWLTEPIIQLFLESHYLGRSLSIEVWNPQGEIVGGTFATVSPGIFTAWSIFYDPEKGDLAGLVADAASLYLAYTLGFDTYDTEEVQAGNLAEMTGGRKVLRTEFMELLDAQKEKTRNVHNVSRMELDLSALVLAPRLSEEDRGRFFEQGGLFNALRRYMRTRGKGNASNPEKHIDTTTGNMLTQFLMQEMTQATPATDALGEKKMGYMAGLKKRYSELKFSQGDVKYLLELLREADGGQRVLTDLRARQITDSIWAAMHLIVRSRITDFRTALRVDLANAEELCDRVGWTYFPTEESVVQYFEQKRAERDAPMVGPPVTVRESLPPDPVQ